MSKPDLSKPYVNEGNIDDDEDERKVMFFGRNLNEIQCFRESFLYGIIGGIGCGLSTFMGTSRVLTSTNVSVYSFATITLVYWFYCRYDMSCRRFYGKQLRKNLEEYTERRGTKYDPDYVPKNNNPDYVPTNKDF